MYETFFHRNITTGGDGVFQNVSDNGAKVNVVDEKLLRQTELKICLNAKAAGYAGIVV